MFNPTCSVDASLLSDRDT